MTYFIALKLRQEYYFFVKIITTDINLLNHKLRFVTSTSIDGN